MFETVVGSFLGFFFQLMNIQDTLLCFNYFLVIARGFDHMLEFAIAAILFGLLCKVLVS